MRNYATAQKESIPHSIAPEIEADYRRELGKLSDFAFAFLNATDGDKAEAEQLLDDFIDIVFEGGALSTWRYRILLADIREGL